MNNLLDPLVEICIDQPVDSIEHTSDGTSGIYRTMICWSLLQGPAVALALGNPGPRGDRTRTPSSSRVLWTKRNDMMFHYVVERI